MIATMTLLLQATQPAGPGSPAGPAGPPGPGSLIQSPFFRIMMMLVVFWVVMFRGNRKEKRKKQEVLDSVAKNDRVLTIGGIIGTVVQVKGDELVLKIDESTNTKMSIVRSAIREVLDREEPASAGSR